MRREVYCIIEKPSGFMKFGISKDPANRLKTLQTSSPNELILLFSARAFVGKSEAAERKLHIALERLPMVKRLRGEWFAVEPAQWTVCVQDYAFEFVAGHDEGSERCASYADFLVAIGQA